MKRKVAEFVAHHQMLSPGSTVVAAVSGGVDSMALLHWLQTQKSIYGISVIAAHCNHGLRPESEEEEAMIRSYCKKKNIPFFATQLPIQETMIKEKRSMHLVARELRHRFFAEVMTEEGANILATAHHGDDQVETMLMKLIRGFQGSRIGIASKRDFYSGQLIRPFLSVTKFEIYTYAADHGVPWREDDSNESDDYTRNRVRKQLVPFMKTENEKMYEHFQIFAEDFADDADYLLRQAEEITARAVHNDGEITVLDLTSFHQQPIPLQRRMIHLLLNYLYKKKRPVVSRIHIEACIKLIRGERPSARISLPFGLDVLRNYDQLRFSFEDEPLKQMKFYKPVDRLPAEVETPIGVLTFEQVAKRGSDSPFVYYCPLEVVNFPLAIRGRRPGDVMRPLGLNGTQKLKQVFIDAKIERHKREDWPVISDAKGTILWLPLLKKGDLGNSLETMTPYLAITLHNKRGR